MSFHRGALGAALVLLLGSLAVYLSAPVAGPVSAAAAGAVSPAFDSITGGASGHVGSRPRPLRDVAAGDAAVPLNVYESTLAGLPAPSVAGIKPRVYVPNSTANTIDVIDPLTFKVIDHFPVGQIPHHIAPAWDMSALYVDNEGSSALTEIDPVTGRPKATIPVPYPYNLYFTPDGSKAVVIVERLSRIDFRDPHNWQLIKSVPIPWRGIDHIDFSADGSYFLGSTEWTGILVKVDTVKMELVGYLDVGGLPIDVRLSPDGSVFFVTNQGRHGVSVVDPLAMKEVAFLPTARGAHGLQVSRNTRLLYVSNRDAGSISVIDIAQRKVVATWPVGGSPDMMQLSPDGRQLWVSGRYNAAIDVIDTETGRLLAAIHVGAGAHGLTFFPNAGLHSLGHNGVYR